MLFIDEWRGVLLNTLWRPFTYWCKLKLFVILGEFIPRIRVQMLLSEVWLHFEKNLKYFENNFENFCISKSYNTTSNLWLRLSRSRILTSKLRLRNTLTPVMQKLTKWHSILYWLISDILWQNGVECWNLSILGWLLFQPLTHPKRKKEVWIFQGKKHILTSTFSFKFVVNCCWSTRVFSLKQVVK